MSLARIRHLGRCAPGLTLMFEAGISPRWISDSTASSVTPKNFAAALFDLVYFWARSMSCRVKFLAAGIYFSFFFRHIKIPIIIWIIITLLLS
jgi:hypothetical protein